MFHKYLTESDDNDMPHGAERRKQAHRNHRQHEKARDLARREARRSKRGECYAG